MHHEQIRSVKKKLGPSLAILAHHYQSDAIVEHADLVGDSLQLAAAIPRLDAGFIVFCGVDFMAETAAVLAGEGQLIFSPDLGATCVMANMAPDSLVRSVLEKLQQSGKVIPLAYVNSSIGVKALCAEYGGSVCTSSNAARMLKWALEQGDRVLFLPDKNLGMNMAGSAGIGPEKVQVLDIRRKGMNIQSQKLQDKKLLLWPGVCAVHFRLKPGHAARIKSLEPEALIVVHPESSPDIVELAHEAGSTSRIIAFTRKAPAGSRIYIGTEDNLVLRLKKENPDKEIFPLGAGYCSNMARITPDLLASCLEELIPEKAVQVDPELAVNARTAVETMLRISA